MTALLRSKKILLLAALCTPLLTGAKADGCGSDVSLGGDNDGDGDGNGCEYGGTQLDVGESFTPDEVGACPDSCTCQADGSVACTLAYCAPPDSRCTYEDGTTYAVGESWLDSAGCNTCSCMEDGMWACTQMACEEPSCAYDGHQFAVGESFPSTDGCNNCSCNEAGVVCTERACACDPELVCDAAISCVGGLLYPTGCGPANCDEAIGPCEATCDPTLVCGQALSCVGGELYPTTCGPANCDDPIGGCELAPCEDPSDPDCPVGCDASLSCAEAETCYDGALYPTGCGPANCDDPIGECSEDACDPTLSCGDAITCVGGQAYPSTCGPHNCDAPLGVCEG